MSAHDSSINQYGSNTGAEEIQKVQKEIQKEAQMQKDVEELATIMNSASPQKQHLFSKNRSPTREPRMQPERRRILQVLFLLTFLHHSKQRPQILLQILSNRRNPRRVRHSMVTNQSSQLRNHQLWI